MTDLTDRFLPAALSAPPTEEQRQAVARIAGYTVALAEVIEQHVPDGRNKSLALTALEDVQMRANRGVFADA